MDPMATWQELFDEHLATDVAVGLVVHLDPDRLLQEGATHTADEVTRVQGQHFFLCIEVGEGFSRWVPLFSNSTPGRVELSQQGRSGHQKWIEGKFHLHPTQVWSASPTVIVNAAARAHDKSRRGSRNAIDQASIPKV